MKKILLIGGGAVGVCIMGVCVLTAISAATVGSRTPTPVAQAQNLAATEKPQATPKPGETPKPTNTPKPTDTPIPPTATSTPKPPTPTVTPQPGIGVPISSAGVVIMANKATKTQGSNQYLRPKAGNTYLVVDVQIGNARTEKAPYNPFYFKLKDASGFEYNTTMPTEQPSLKSGELGQKDTVRGLVQFEVPTGATGFILSYKPMVLFSDYQEIKIVLEPVD